MLSKLDIIIYKSIYKFYFSSYHLKSIKFCILNLVRNARGAQFNNFSLSAFVVKCRLKTANLIAVKKASSKEEKKTRQIKSKCL